MLSFFIPVNSKSSLILWFFEDFKMFRTVILINLYVSLGSVKPIPSCLNLIRRWLIVPEMIIPSHLRIYRFTFLSRFCTIQVYGRRYNVRSHLSVLCKEGKNVDFLWIVTKSLYIITFHIFTWHIITEFFPKTYKWVFYLNCSDHFIVSFT